MGRQRIEWISYPLESLNPLKRVIGILIKNWLTLEFTEIMSQSPKAGHRYSDLECLEISLKACFCLNPLKRVIGILIKRWPFSVLP